MSLYQMDKCNLSTIPGPSWAILLLPRTSRLRLEAAVLTGRMWFSSQRAVAHSLAPELSSRMTLTTLVSVSKPRAPHRMERRHLQHPARGGCPILGSFLSCFC